MRTRKKRAEENSEPPRSQGKNTSNQKIGTLPTRQRQGCRNRLPKKYHGIQEACVTDTNERTKSCLNLKCITANRDK